MRLREHSTQQQQKVNNKHSIPIMRKNTQIGGPCESGISGKQCRHSALHQKTWLLLKKCDTVCVMFWISTMTYRLFFFFTRTHKVALRTASEKALLALTIPSRSTKQCERTRKDSHCFYVNDPRGGEVTQTSILLVLWVSFFLSF